MIIESGIILCNQVSEIHIMSNITLLYNLPYNKSFTSNNLFIRLLALKDKHNTIWCNNFFRTMLRFTPTCCERIRIFGFEYELIYCNDSNIHIEKRKTITLTYKTLTKSI